MKDGERGKIKIVIAAYCAVLLWSAAWSSACGSTAATGSDSSGDGSTLQVTGTVQVPTITTSSSLSKAVGSKAVSDAAASGLTCKLYTLDGTKIGEATSGSDGTFTVTATLSTLKGSTTGTSWTTTVESVCTDSTGAIEIRSYRELTVVEGTTTSVPVGTLDSTTTLAAANVEWAHQDSSGTAGCEPSTGQSCSVVSSATDVSCLFAADQTIWKLGSTSGSGGVDEAGWLISVLRAAQAGGMTPTTLGESNWGAVLRKLRRNELSAALITQLATATATALGSDVEELNIFLTAATSLSSSIRTVLTDTFAGNAGTATVGSSTPCALGEADTNYMQALVTPLLGTADTSDIATVYGDADAWSAWAKTLNQVTDASYTRFIGRYVGLHAFLEERKTDATLSTWDSEDAVLLYNMLDLDFFDQTSATDSTIVDYFTGWANVDAGTCVFSGTWDGVRADYVDANFQTTSYDPDTYNFSTLTTTLTTETFSSTTQTTCESSYSTNDLQKACYDAKVGALPLTEDFTGDVVNAFPGWTLENGSLVTITASSGVALVAVVASTTIDPASASTRWRYSTARNENGLIVEAKLTSASGLAETGDGVILFVGDSDAKAECALEQSAGISVTRTVSGGTGSGSAITLTSSVDTVVPAGYLPVTLRLTLDAKRTTVTCSYSSGGNTTLSNGGTMTFTEALTTSYTGGFELQNTTGSLPLHIGVDKISISEP